MGFGIGFLKLLGHFTKYLGEKHWASVIFHKCTPHHVTPFASKCPKLWVSSAWASDPQHGCHDLDQLTSPGGLPPLSQALLPYAVWTGLTKLLIPRNQPWTQSPADLCTYCFLCLNPLFPSLYLANTDSLFGNHCNYDYCQSFPNLLTLG